jgi:hypothetical protein
MSIYQWNACDPGPDYTVAVDWSNDGTFTELGDDVTTDVLTQGVVIEYGRDQDRQLAPGAIGRASFTLCNVSRDYSPENDDSPLFGDLEPARPVQIQANYAAVDYPLFTGRIDDFNVNADRGSRNVGFTLLDTLSLLQNNPLSTELFEAKRSGEIVNQILDEIGWTAGRDIDVGGSYFPYWWSESDAFDELQNVVLSEGPPAIAYVAPDGTFTFKDRHHRLLDAAALTSQASFAAARVVCDAPAVTGLDYTDPFVYQHGWRDIVNSVSFSVNERLPDPGISMVWSSEDTISMSIGETVTLDVETTDPFRDAQDLVDGTDIIHTGSVTTVLSRTSGQSLQILITASTAAVVTYVQLRARSVPVARVIRVTAEDSTSIAAHGRRTYPNQAIWANANDAAAIASIILAHYAFRRPTVKVRVVAQDPTHLVQILSRTISDRITIRNDELGLNDDFHIESVAHTIRRLNPDAGPVHAVIFGCERVLITNDTNPFTFDKAGAGFDDGTFGVTGIDDPGTVFIFDHATQGQFDVGLFGT